MHIKINILFELKDGARGGGNQFLKALKAEFIKKEIYEKNPEKADIIIYNSHHFIDQVLKLKYRYPNKIFIHRVAGPLSVVSNRIASWDYFLSKFDNKIADGLIFQSNWSKKENKEKFEYQNKNEEVIINAVNKNIFYPADSKKKTNKKTIIGVSWSTHQNKGLDAYTWLDNNLDFDKYEVIFVGHINKKFNNVKIIAPVTQKKLAELIRGADIYLFPSKLEACSNALIEGLSCGLPVIAKNGSSNQEIVDEGGEFFDSNEELIEKIDKITLNYDYYRNRIITPSMEIVGEKYFSFIKKVKKETYKPKRINLFNYLSWRLRLTGVNFKNKIDYFLHLLRKKMKIDVKYFFQGGFWMSLSQITSFLSVMIISLIYANLLDQSSYGNIVFVLSVMSIFYIPVLGGMDTALTQSIAEGGDQNLVPALKEKIKWGLLSILGIAILGIYYIWQENYLLGYIFLSISIIAPLSNAFLIYQSVWNGKKRFDLLAKYNILWQFIFTGTIVTTLLLTKNILLFLIIYFLVQLLIGFIFFVLARKKLKIVDKKIENKVISYGKHLSLINVIEIIANNIDKLLLWSFLGPEILAIYTIAYMPIKELRSLFAKITNPLIIPKLVVQSKDTFATLRKQVFLISLVVVFFILGYILISPFLFRIFFNQYSEAIIYTKIFSITLLTAPFMFLGSALTAKLKKRELYWQNIISNGFKIIAILVLVPTLKLWGLVIAIIAASFFKALILLIFFNKSFLKRS